MANQTQSYSLFQLLKDGDVVKKETIAQSLGIKLMSVPVYIHALKSEFKADVVGVRDGRKVTGYKLVLETGKKAVDVPKFRKNSKGVIAIKSKIVSAVKKTVISELGELPVIDKDASTQIDAREFADVANSLGIGGNTSYSFNE